MADGIAITPGSGVTVDTDDLGAAGHVQRIKPVWGADGIGTDAQVAQPLPVQTTVESTQMSNLGTIVTPKFASINTSSSGDTQIVIADATRKIRVISYVIVSDGVVAAMFRSGTTALMGAVSLNTNTGVSAPFCPVGHFETAANAALNLNLSAAIGVRGHLTYVLI